MYMHWSYFCPCMFSKVHGQLVTYVQTSVYIHAVFSLCSRNESEESRMPEALGTYKYLGNCLREMATKLTDILSVVHHRDRCLPLLHHLDKSLLDKVFTGISLAVFMMENQPIILTADTLQPRGLLKDCQTGFQQLW